MGGPHLRRFGRCRAVAGGRGGHAARGTVRRDRVLKVVFVDWTGTLSVSRFLEHWKVSGERREADFDAFQTFWRSEPMDDWLLGRESAEDYFGRVALALGLPVSQVLKEAREGCAGWTLIDPNTVPLIERLRERGTRVVLATENVDALERWILPAMGLENVFDDILNSARLGLLKSDFDAVGRSRFFVPYLEAKGIGPGESVLIDDSVDLAPKIEKTGIRFLYARFGTGPCAHLQTLLT